jgi:hypothetical protein
MGTSQPFTRDLAGCLCFQSCCSLSQVKPISVTCEGVGVFLWLLNVTGAALFHFLLLFDLFHIHSDLLFKLDYLLKTSSISGRL